VKPRRTERLGEQIRDEVAVIVARELKDPRIGGFVTVTRVELAADLSMARVFVSVLGSPKQAEDTIKGLRAGAGFVRRAIGQRLRIRQTPAIEFVLDKGLEHADRVGQLLDEVAKADAAAPRGDAEPEGDDEPEADDDAPEDDDEPEADDDDPDRDEK
jgi:ribosome-binding factor A